MVEFVFSPPPKGMNHAFALHRRHRSGTEAEEAGSLQWQDTVAKLGRKRLSGSRGSTWWATVVATLLRAAGSSNGTST